MRRPLSWVGGTALLLAVLPALPAPAFPMARPGRWTTHGPEGGPVYALAISRVAPKTIYAAAAGGGVFRTFDGGDRWKRVDNGLTDVEVTALAVSPFDPDWVLAGTVTNGAYETLDAGRSWQRAGLTRGVN